MKNRNTTVAVMMGLGILTVIGVWIASTRKGPSDTQKPDAKIVTILCAQERYGGSLQRCESAGQLFYRTHPGNRVMDAPDGIYDTQGKIIVYCGGLQPMENKNETAALCAQYSSTNCVDVTTWCK